MRIATPFSTWLRIIDRCESATSLEISRPRLIGPGCSTIASGLASLTCSKDSPEIPEVLVSWENTSTFWRSSWTRSIMITSASRTASCMRLVRLTPGARRVKFFETVVAGPHATMSTPNFDNRWMLERATREWAMSPMIATRSPWSVPFHLQDRQRVEQRLRGVFVLPVSGVDHRRGKMPREEVRRTGRRVAHHDDVGIHRCQGVQRIDERLALGEARTERLDADRIGAEPLGGDFETRAGARRRLEEQVDDRPPAEGVELLARRYRLEMPAAIEQTLDLSAIQVFDSQQVPGIGASGVQILSQSPADSMIPGRQQRLSRWPRSARSGQHKGVRDRIHQLAGR